MIDLVDQPIAITVAAPSEVFNVVLVPLRNGLSSLTMTLQWESPSNTGDVSVQYFLSISPTPLSRSSVTVETTSVVITAQYNTHYNVTIRAENCAGMSDGVTSTVEIIACQWPLTPADRLTITSPPSAPVMDSTLTFTCNGQSLVSTCDSQRRWPPNPETYFCPVPVTCTIPASPTNGFVILTSNTTIVFGCNEGFSPQQNRTANCVAMDQWSCLPEENMCSMAPSASTPVPLSPGAAAGVSLAVSAVVFTILGFLAGLLVMYLITHKKAVCSPTEGQANIQSTVPPGPVYEDVLPTPKEEIELKTNDAYGPVRQ